MVVTDEMLHFPLAAKEICVLICQRMCGHSYEFPKGLSDCVAEFWKLSFLFLAAQLCLPNPNVEFKAQTN